MAITRQMMTDEQRKSVALEYLKAFDNKGVTSSGASILDLFAEDAQVFFPKWGLATGQKQIGQLFTDFGGLIVHILHDYATFNWVMTGTDTFAVEGTSAGQHTSGPWRAGVSHGGRWCVCSRSEIFSSSVASSIWIPTTLDSIPRAIRGYPPAAAMHRHRWETMEKWGRSPITHFLYFNKWVIGLRPHFSSFLP